jgi:hypothetical protein
MVARPAATHQTQLEELDNRQQQLDARLGPLVGSLPRLREQLAAGPPPPAPSPWLCGFPSLGVRPVWQQDQQPQAEGQQQQAQQQQQQQEQQQQQPGRAHDRFGVLVALGPGATALVTWKDFVRAVSLASAAAEQLLSGAAVGQVARFAAERRALVRPLGRDGAEGSASAAHARAAAAGRGGSPALV